MPSSLQVPPAGTIFDYEYGIDGKPLVNALVTCTLSANRATLGAPQVNIETGTVRTTTDANGYWQLTLVANVAALFGTWYTIQVGSRTMRVSVSLGTNQASLNLVP